MELTGFFKQLLMKLYAAIPSGLTGSLVDTGSTQTITGAKTFTTGQTIVEDGAAGATPFIVRQTGGVVGTDELQISHDGTHAYISARSGNLYLDGQAGAISFLQQGGNQVGYISNADFVFGGNTLNSAGLILSVNALTAGTLTQANSALVRKTTHSFTWTNAMVVALGGNLTGDITVCTLPAKTVVTNAYIVITGAATGPATLTVALGRTSATYLDYIAASDAKAAANTVYGDASGERGANLTGYDLPSYTGTTAIKIHFIATVSNLDQTLSSTGTVILETMLVP